MNELNQNFEEQVSNSNVVAYDQIYKDAINLMNSQDLAVFDLKKESAKTKEMYGDTKFGQSCLMARRLVEKGVRFVELSHGGWDDHYGIYDDFNERAQSLDQGVACLIADLADCGLLDSTLVVLTTEFGRSAKLNSRAGRNHHPRAYSSILAGGGIQGGQKYGKTDEIGHAIADKKVTVQDFNATIAHAMGLNLNHVEYSAEKRPFTIAKKGQPILDLF